MKHQRTCKTRNETITVDMWDTSWRILRDRIYGYILV